MNDDVYFKILLREFGVPEIFDTLKSNGITYDSLPYLSDHDIQDALKNIRQRAIFRERLLIWRKRELLELTSPLCSFCISPVPCFKCGKYFLILKNFIEHLELDHSLSRSTVECKMNNCNKQFWGCKALKNHMQDKHLF